jgi:hypothetical protein
MDKSGKGGEFMKKIVFFLAVFALMAGHLPALAQAELSAADKEFLLQQCQVPQEDVDVFPKLDKRTQTGILGYIIAKDCQKLVPYKESRNFYRHLLQLKPDEKMPKLPPRWDFAALTEEEFLNYVDILNKHPDEESGTKK